MREHLPTYLRVALVAFAGAGVALVMLDHPGWLSLVHVTLALGLLVLVAREVGRNPGAIALRRPLWVIAAAILVVAALSLTASTLS